MGAQTETELKEKKLRVEDALNATKASYPGTRQFNGGVFILRIKTSGRICITR